jgi:hypothetical protein
MQKQTDHGLAGGDNAGLATTAAKQMQDWLLEVNTKSSSVERKIGKESSDYFACTEKAKSELHLDLLW